MWFTPIWYSNPSSVVSNPYVIFCPTNISPTVQKITTKKSNPKEQKRRIQRFKKEKKGQRDVFHNVVQRLQRGTRVSVCRFKLLRMDMHPHPHPHTHTHTHTHAHTHPHTHTHTHTLLAWTFHYSCVQDQGVEWNVLCIEFGSKRVDALEASQVQTHSCDGSVLDGRFNVFHGSIALLGRTAGEKNICLCFSGKENWGNC